MLMFGTQPELVLALRAMARQGSKPSEMVREILSHCKSEGESVDRNLLVQYFSEAFCLSDGQAYPLFGWLPGGSGELQDSDIDELLGKRIQQAQGDWKQVSEMQAKGK
jgi:hypothetical protein